MGLSPHPAIPLGETIDSDSLGPLRQPARAPGPWRRRTRTLRRRLVDPASQDHRLRARPACRRYRVAGDDRRRCAPGHASLHGARAMDGPGGRPPHRRLCDGCHLVSSARRPCRRSQAPRVTCLCAQHCNDQPPSLALLNPSVSEGLARAVERALSKNPDDRFPDAAAMLARSRGAPARKTDRPGDSSHAARLRQEPGAPSSNFAGTSNHPRGSSGRWSPTPIALTEPSAFRR